LWQLSLVRENIHDEDKTNSSDAKEEVCETKQDFAVTLLVRRKDAALGSDKPFFVCVFSRFLPRNTWNDTWIISWKCMKKTWKIAWGYQKQIEKL